MLKSEGFSFTSIWWASSSNEIHKHQSYFPEAVIRKCSVKKFFLNILQNSQENTCVEAFLIKLQGLA